MLPALANGRHIPAANLGQVLRDHFTDANGTSLASHTPDYKAISAAIWTLSGTWTVQSNRAQRGGAFAVTDAAWIECGQANVSISADVVHQVLSELLARVTDQDNNWRGVILSGGFDQVRITERNAASNVIRASASFAPVDDGQTYRLRLVVDGQTVTFFVNGVQKLQYTAASFNQTKTKHGFGINATAGTATTKFDNFKVTL